jgi:DNA-binding NarL/FixJ family response regulator
MLSLIKRTVATDFSTPFLNMNTLHQETTSSSGGGSFDLQEKVTLLCQAAIDSLTATIENVRVQNSSGQLREVLHATQTIRNLTVAIDQPADSGSIALDSFGARQGKTKTVVICDTQPMVVEGLRTLLNASPDMRLQEAVDSLSKVTEILNTCPPSILMVDRAFGMQPVLDWLSALKSIPSLDQTSSTKIVVWGSLSTPEETYRLLKAGAHATLCKTDPATKILECLRTAADGGVWIGDLASQESSHPRLSLTAREQQILELIEHGFKNKDIAQELGIREGTVKIHLRNVFQKTGVRSRHALAIQGLRDHGSKSPLF